MAKVDIQTGQTDEWYARVKGIIRGLDELRWLEKGACNDAPDPDAWWPERGTPNAHGLVAKRICAGCPVRLPCLVDALARGEKHGIRGGAGGAWRRSLRRAFLTCTHDPMVACEDETCEWDAAVASHWARLDTSTWWCSTATVPPPLAFPVDNNVTHGRRGTYAKGCRDAPCRWAASTVGQALAAAGIDTAGFWADAVGQADLDDPRDAAAAVLVATVLAGVRLGEVPPSKAVHLRALDLAKELGHPEPDVEAAA